MPMKPPAAWWAAAVGMPVCTTLPPVSRGATALRLKGSGIQPSRVTEGTAS